MGKPVQKTEKKLDFGTELNNLGKKLRISQLQDRVKGDFRKFVEAFGGKGNMNQEAAKIALLKACELNPLGRTDYLEGELKMFSDIWTNIFGLTDEFPEEEFRAALTGEGKPISTPAPRAVAEAIAKDLEGVYHNLALAGIPKEVLSDGIIQIFSETPTPMALREPIIAAVEILWDRLDFPLPYPAEKVREAVESSPPK